MIDVFFDADCGISRLAMQGRITLEELLEAIDWSFEQSNSRARVLWDLRKNNLEETSYDELQLVKQHLEKKFAQIAPLKCKTAYLAEGDVALGVSRADASELANLPRDLKVFDDEEMAIAWLIEP